jgi:aldoxime dehydratase
MESAIAQHLKCPRSRNRRVEDDYAPPYPCWVARAQPSLKQVVMGYFGVQSRGPDMLGQARAALRMITKSCEGVDGPGHHDLTHYVDAAGYDNMIAIAYWSDPPSFERWRATPAFDSWWKSEERLHEGVGYFQEIASPRIEHYETMFNTPDRLEGVGVVMGGVSQDIQEHGYWGSARDRIPLSQTNAMNPSGTLRLIAGAPALGQRVRVAGHENVAMIRSGQEWTETESKERDLYLNDMEPVLREGMDFLRDKGTEIGCYTNRYMQHIDASGRPVEKTFGVSYWRSLADMERWSESHPTHVAIFGTFMRIVQELQFQLKLRVYHEVSVLKADEQYYEYVNCHPKTGLLNGITA